MEQTINSTFTELAKLIAESQADELEQKQQLPMPRDSYIKQKMTALIFEFEQENKKLLHYMEKARQILVENINFLPLIEQEHHAKELLTAMIKLNDSIEIEQVITAGSWQNFLGFTNETIFWIYSLGYKFFEEKNYEDALSLFLMLTLLNPTVSDNWIALGFAQKNLSLETQALYSLSIASMVNPNNPTSRYQSAEIYLHLNDFDKALIELEALSKIINNQKLDSLKPELESMLNKAKNRQSL